MEMNDYFFFIGIASEYLLITCNKPNWLVETWLVSEIIWNERFQSSVVPSWGLLSLQSCQDICAWACIDDPNLQEGEACF